MTRLLLAPILTLVTDCMRTVDMSVDLTCDYRRSLGLRNPVCTASGTFGWGYEYEKLIDIQRLGAIFSKATTRRARQGNPQPRIAETPSGMLNSIGLQNPGVDAVVRKIAPIWTRWRVPVVVNVAGESVEDYWETARRLDGVEGVAGIELNISCPNVSRGLIFGCDAALAAEVTAAVREATSLPLIVKLSPNVTSPVPIAEAIEAAGADAISLINTLIGMQIDTRARQPYIARVTAGLSGPAVKPVALRMVWEVAQAVAVPIVGIGGIATAQDALEFIMAGASAVQIGTATFRNPRASLQVLDGLEAFCRTEGIAAIRDLIGAALPAGRPTSRRPGSAS
jgi:dihydroorotate dehydrogenase (NAD+) catalytic subunit